MIQKSSVRKNSRSVSRSLASHTPMPARTGILILEKYVLRKHLRLYRLKSRGHGRQHMALNLPLKFTVFT